MNAGSKLRHILTVIVLAPFWLPLLVAVFLAAKIMYVLAYISGCIVHRRWKQKLAHSGRIARPTEIPDAGANGTFIVDRPALGWNSTHCWWTPVDICDIAAIPIPSDDDRRQFIDDTGALEHPFDRWCYDTFLSVDTGTGLLLSTRRGDRMAIRLQHDRPGAKLIKTWSAPCVAANLNGDTGAKA